MQNVSTDECDHKRIIAHSPTIQTTRLVLPYHTLQTREQPLISAMAPGHQQFVHPKSISNSVPPISKMLIFIGSSRTLVSRILSPGTVLTIRRSWIDDVVVNGRIQQGHTHTRNSRSSVDILSRYTPELLHFEGYLKRAGQGSHLNMVRKLTR